MHKLIRNVMYKLAIIIFVIIGFSAYGLDKNVYITSNISKNNNLENIHLISLESSDSDYPNPERGFYKRAQGPAFVRRQQLRDYADSGTRLTHMYGNLSEYRKKDIPIDVLDQMNRGMDIVRDEGLKVILRFFYYQEDIGADATLNQITRHISQLTPLFVNHEDVIALVEMGFIGPWGEGYRSSNGIHKDGPKIKIRNALLEAVPSSRQIATRYPKNLQDWYPDDLNPDDLFSSELNPMNRIGNHNDCFLSSDNDLTYTDSKNPYINKYDSQRMFMKRRSNITVSGGETCNPRPTARMSCEDILAEGAAYHMTYLNYFYNKDFINRWLVDGCLRTVSKSLGYRLELNEVKFPKKLNRGEDFLWEIKISNTGWARPINSRYMILRLANKDDVFDINLSGSDLRKISAGKSINIQGKDKIFEDIHPGTYRVYIGAPDISNRLKNDIRYSIRFANKDNVEKGIWWDENQGFLNLGVSVLLE